MKDRKSQTRSLTGSVPSGSVILVCVNGRCKSKHLLSWWWAYCVINISRKLTLLSIRPYTKGVPLLWFLTWRDVRKARNKTFDLMLIFRSPPTANALSKMSFFIGILTVPLRTFSIFPFNFRSLKVFVKDKSLKSSLGNTKSFFCCITFVLCAVVVRALPCIY